MPAGSSIMLSSAPARVRVKTRFAGPRGRTTRSSTAAVRARSCARRIVRSPAPSRKVSPRRSKRTCLGRGGRKTPSRASSTRPTPAMSNSPLSDKCEVDPRSTTATRKWPANGTTDSTLSPLPEPQPRAEGAKRTLGLALLSTLLRSRSPRHAVSSKQAGTSVNPKPKRGRGEGKGFVGRALRLRSGAGRGTSCAPPSRPSQQRAAFQPVPPRRLLGREAGVSPGTPARRPLR
jgi:hypothetical protein